MKNTSDNWQLEYLLREKAYHELSPEEQAWVMERVDVETYARMRKTLLSSQRVFREEQTRPAPEIHARLRRHLRQQRQSTWQQLASYRLPAWQAAAASVLFLLLFLQMREAAPSVPEQIIVYHTDTIYKEMPVEVQTGDSDSAIGQATNLHSIRHASAPHSRPARSVDRRSKATDHVYRSSGPTTTVVFNGPPNTNYDTAALNRLIDTYLDDHPRRYHRATVDSNLMQSVGRVY